jgi:hypothetical protein
MGYPSVYPTGVTVYDPERAWSGYTIFQAPGAGALLIDMSGREVQLWQGLQGFPNKLLPGGQVFGSSGEREPRFGAQDAPGQEPLTDRGTTLVLAHDNVSNPAISDRPLLDDKIIEVDWEGNIIWQWRPHEHFEELGFDARRARRCARIRTCEPPLRGPSARPRPRQRGMETGCTSTRSRRSAPTAGTTLAISAFSPTT